MLLSDEVSLLDDEEQALLGSSGAGFRHLVEHRLVSDRLQELYEGLKAADKPSESAALRKSLVCSTIAGGIPRRFASQRFGLRIETMELHRLFPQVGGVIQTVPPIEPWLIGERLVQKVETDLQLSRARAWSYAAHACRCTPGRYTEAAAAASTVDRIAARFGEQLLLQATRARAWSTAAEAWREQGEHDRAAAAAERALSLASKFRTPEGIAAFRTAAESARRLLDTLIANEPVQRG